MISKEHLLKICKELNLEFVEDNQSGCFHYILLTHPKIYNYNNKAIICKIECDRQINLFGQTYYTRLDFPETFIKNINTKQYYIDDFNCCLGILAPLLTKRFLNYYHLMLEYLATKEKRNIIKSKINDLDSDFL